MAVPLRALSLSSKKEVTWNQMIDRSPVQDNDLNRRTYRESHARHGEQVCENNGHIGCLDGRPQAYWSGPCGHCFCFECFECGNRRKRNKTSRTCMNIDCRLFFYYTDRLVKLDVRPATPRWEHGSRAWSICMRCTVKEIWDLTLFLFFNKNSKSLTRIEAGGFEEQAKKRKPLSVREKKFS